MHIYTIGDLHLSMACHKPMDIFGDRWTEHDKKIAEAWQSVVSSEDVVVVPGDISWACSFEEVLPDLLFLEKLPGRKILLKGNHEYWWSTGRKLEQLREKNHLTSISFLYNNYIYIEEKNICICGTRGWKCCNEGDRQSFTDQDAKICNREILRLEMSLKGGAKKECEIFTFLHYPPFGCGQEISGFTRLLEAYRVGHCYYGHLHGPAHKWAVNGKLSPESFTEYFLVSADYLNFSPLLVI